MSDERPASDWWLANDGRWYAPEQHPDFQAQLPPPPSDPSPGPGWWKANDGRWYPPAPREGTAGDEHTTGPTVIGDAGGSAKRQAEAIRRRADNWDAGAEGEALTALELNKLTAAYHVLHDLHVPGSTANIDHLVVGPSGVWLIDTKAYSAPLRYHDGTVWRGKYPMRKETAAVADYARAVSLVLRVPVAPVLCFIKNSVPPEASLLGSVRLVSLEDLLALVTGTSGMTLSDVDSVARLAKTLRTPTPSIEPPTVQQRSKRFTRGEMKEPQSRPRSTAKKRPTPAGKKKTKGGSPLVAMAMAVGGLVVACVALNGVSKNVSEATTTIAPPPLDGQTIEVMTPNVGIAAICVTSGEGWQVNFVWPSNTDRQYEPVAYEVVSLTPTIVIEPKLWLGKNGTPDPVTGVAPNTTVNVAAQGILADGTRLSPTMGTRVVPDRPC